jgi:hypothetical protein
LSIRCSGARWIWSPSDSSIWPGAPRSQHNGEYLVHYLQLASN